MTKPRLLFITGTDTGVGKTLLTGLTLTHLRRSGCHALAVKPYCSGGRGDATLLSALQDHELPMGELNPFFFPEPVAPLVSARWHRRSISLARAVTAIKRVARRCECLLIEGSGGLLVPLGEDYTVLELIEALEPEVIVAARNKLGTLNHTLLTVRALQSLKLRLKVVLMNSGAKDVSCRANAAVLAEWLAPVPFLEIPFLGSKCRTPAAVRTAAARLGETLGRIVEPPHHSPSFKRSAAR
jgi:dethiobiotin synthetase